MNKQHQDLIRVSRAIGAVCEWNNKATSELAGLLQHITHSDGRGVYDLTVRELLTLIDTTRDTQ